MLELVQEIDNKSLVDKAEQQLIELFIKNEFKAGDIVPKELELACAMGVSRTVIREALTRLKVAGLVESIRHKGTIITNPNLIQSLKRSLIPNLMDKDSLRDAFELRIILEIGMADTLFANITSDDIQILEAIVSTEPEHSKEVLFDIEHEIKFHGKLYEITKNKTLKNFQQMLLPIFNYVYESGLIQNPIRSKTYASHKELVDILKNGTPTKFRNAMRKHLNNHIVRFNLSSK